jgi:phosphate starvation-inducible PhoH-like protein
MNKIMFLATIITQTHGFRFNNIFRHKHHITNSKKVNKINKLKLDYFEDTKFEYDIKSTNYVPTTINQQKYVNYLDDKDVSLLFALGPAGSGKTLFACVYAINALKEGSINKIILTRPIVSVEDEEIGFLPGSLQHKMDPWTKPIFDIFLEYYKQHEIDYMIKESIIEISPLSFMRGRTFKNSIIIADEMQNSTPKQMLMLTTRVGINSKMIITGDLLQTDRLIDNGLSDIITRINKYENTTSQSLINIKLVEMTEIDIQRSELVKDILNIYK